MKIKSLMIPDPVTITEDASISEALGIMKTNAIRHLPVVAEDKVLKGLVTLADLKQGLIPSMVADVSLKDLMIRDPITVEPEDDIEVAARFIYNNKIGGIPVLEDGKLVGIITESDILRTFIDMMGILSSSSRIDVVMKNGPAALKKVFQVVQEHGGDVLSVGLAFSHGKKRAYYFRLSSCDTQAVRTALEKEGFEIPDVIE